MGLKQRLFGPNREAIWRQLSEQVQGRYVDGGFWNGGKVQVDHQDWTLTLDSYAVSTGHSHVVLTRLRAPYVNPSGFRFTVYRKSLFSGLGKFFGMQDIEVGDPQFDDDFIVKATDDFKVREFLANERIRGLLASEKDVNFTVKDDEGWFGTRFPDGVDELCFQVTGVITDPDRLKRLFELFAETLDELVRMGAAEDSPPNVDLK